MTFCFISSGGATVRIYNWGVGVVGWVGGRQIKYQTSRGSMPPVKFGNLESLKYHFLHFV